MYKEIIIYIHIKLIEILKAQQQPLVYLGPVQTWSWLCGVNWFTVVSWADGEAQIDG